MASTLSNSVVVPRSLVTQPVPLTRQTTGPYANLGQLNGPPLWLPTLAYTPGQQVYYNSAGYSSLAANYRCIANSPAGTPPADNTGLVDPRWSYQWGGEPAWNAATQYQPGDVVSYTTTQAEPGLFMCLQPARGQGTTGQVPTPGATTAYWKVMSSTGGGGGGVAAVAASTGIVVTTLSGTATVRTNIASTATSPSGLNSGLNVTTATAGGGIQVQLSTAIAPGANANNTASPLNSGLVMSNDTVLNGLVLSTDLKSGEGVTVANSATGTGLTASLALTVDTTLVKTTSGTDNTVALGVALPTRALGRAQLASPSATFSCPVGSNPLTSVLMVTPRSALAFDSGGGANGHCQYNLITNHSGSEWTVSVALAFGTPPSPLPSFDFSFALVGT